jgi:hypothetical protein
MLTPALCPRPVVGGSEIRFASSAPVRRCTMGNGQQLEAS